MTDQIIIKLNKRKFRPILDKLNNLAKGAAQSNSWQAGFAVWFFNDLLREKREHLGGISIVDHLIQKSGLSRSEMLMYVMGKYIQFLKDHK
jgi:hypothetical protein